MLNLNLSKSGKEIVEGWKDTTWYDTGWKEEHSGCVFLNFSLFAHLLPI